MELPKDFLTLLRSLLYRLLILTTVGSLYSFLGMMWGSDDVGCCFTNSTVWPFEAVEFCESASEPMGPKYAVGNRSSTSSGSRGSSTAVTVAVAVGVVVAQQKSWAMPNSLT